MRKVVAESGRSMLEMLGVLAIVGVLTAGALVGYSHALDSYRANQAIDEVETIITDIIELHSLGRIDSVNYEDVGILKDSTIAETLISGASFSFDGISYYVPMLKYNVKGSVATCNKLLLAGWSERLSTQILQVSLVVYRKIGTRLAMLEIKT